MIGDTTKPPCNAPFLIGSKVYLRPLEQEDLPCIRTWLNDPVVRPLIGEVTPMSMPAAEAYFERISHDTERVWFAIVLRENDRLIGETGLLRIFYPWRTADLSIIIGDKFAWGKGYGCDALRLLLDYAFGSLSLHRVAIGVNSFNERALRFYEKAGFVREGIQRDGIFHSHAFQDVVMLSMLEEDYRAHYPSGH